MHNFLALIALLVVPLSLHEASEPARVPLVATEDPANPKFDLSTTGIEWHRGIESVLDQDKPILLFQLLGNFDDAFC
jgi:hypothetical protein